MNFQPHNINIIVMKPPNEEATIIYEYILNPNEKNCCQNLPHQKISTSSVVKRSFQHD